MKRPNLRYKQTETSPQLVSLKKMKNKNKNNTEDNWLLRWDPLKASGWTIFLMLLIGMMLLILMASMSLNEEFLFSKNEITISTIVVFFFAINGLFIRQLIKFISGGNSRKRIAQEFSIACLAGILNIIIFSIIYYMYGVEGVDDKGKIITIENDMWTSLYFSIVTWTTLGYGDFKPTVDLRLVAALEALLGYLYMSILVGIFINSMRINVKPQG